MRFYTELGKTDIVSKVILFLAAGHFIVVIVCWVSQRSKEIYDNENRMLHVFTYTGGGFITNKPTLAMKLWVSAKLNVMLATLANL